MTAPPRPRRRTAADARLAETRRRIVASALTVFGERGYANATIDEIAASAQTSRTTFYAHFRSKAALVEAVMRAGIPGSRDHFARLDRLGVPSRAEVENWVEETVQYWRRYGPVIDIMRQAIAAEPTLHSLMIDLVDESIAGMPNYLSRLPDDPPTARLRAAALILQLEQFCFFWLMRGADFDRAAAISVLTDIWFREFGGRAD